MKRSGRSVRSSLVQVLLAGTVAWSVVFLAKAPDARSGVNLRPVILDQLGFSTDTLPIVPGQTVTQEEVDEGCALRTNTLTGALLPLGGRTLIRFGARTRNVGSSNLVIGSPGCNCVTDFNCNAGFECGLAHGHPHYKNFVGAELKDPSKQLIGEGRKYGFCIIDVGGGPGCNNFGCGNMGITAGCYDEYGWGFECQYIDLTGYEIPAGQYTFSFISDPNNKIAEDSNSDNTDTATVTVPCSPGTPCEDNNRCTYGETCNGSGACTGGTCGPGAACGDGGCNVPCLANSDPAAVSWAAGRVDLFWRGSDNALWHMWYDNAAPKWWGPQNLGGNLKGDPSVASWAPGRLDVFWRGLDDQLHHKWYESGWSGDGSLGGNMRGDPVAIAWGANRLDIVYEGTNDDLKHIYWNGSAWSGIESHSAGIESPLGMISWYANHLDVFWKNSAADLVHSYWNGSTWSANESFTASVTSAPSPIDFAAGRIDVFWRNTSDDLVWKAFSSAWGGNANLDGNVTSRPSPVSWYPNHLDVFWRGGDNALKHKWTGDAGGSWSGVDDLGGSLSSRPVALSWGNGHIDVFWLGGGVVMNKRYIGGNWSPERQLY